MLKFRKHYNALSVFKMQLEIYIVAWNHTRAFNLTKCYLLTYVDVFFFIENILKHPYRTKYDYTIRVINGCHYETKYVGQQIKNPSRRKINENYKILS